jgi:hypothetical protein
MSVRNISTSSDMTFSSTTFECTPQNSRAVIKAPSNVKRKLLVLVIVYVDMACVRLAFCGLNSAFLSHRKIRPLPTLPRFGTAFIVSFWFYIRHFWCRCSPFSRVLEWPELDLFLTHFCNWLPTTDNQSRLLKKTRLSLLLKLTSCLLIILALRRP